jgi:hypothetical protein
VTLVYREYFQTGFVRDKVRLVDDGGYGINDAFDGFYVLYFRPKPTGRRFFRRRCGRWFSCWHNFSSSSNETQQDCGKLQKYILKDWAKTKKLKNLMFNGASIQV